MLFYGKTCYRQFILLKNWLSTSYSIEKLVIDKLFDRKTGYRPVILEKDLLSKSYSI